MYMYVFYTWLTKTIDSKKVLAPCTYGMLSMRLKSMLFTMHLRDDNLPHICQCHVIIWIKAAKGWRSLLALALTLWLWHRALLRAAFIQCSITAFLWSFGLCNLWHEYLLVSLLHGFGGLADPLAQWPIVHSESTAKPTRTEMAKEMTV